MICAYVGGNWTIQTIFSTNYSRVTNFLP